MPVSTFADILKFNPYHDSKGRFASADAATSFTYAPGKSTAHDAAIQRAKDAHEAASSKGFKGTLYHGSPATDIEEFDMSLAGSNTTSGEKLLFFTDSKQLAEDFSYERLEGSTKYFQRRGEKGRVYEVDVEIKNPLDFRNLSDKDIDNILKLDIEGVLTREDVISLSGNHQLLKTNLDLRAESLKKLGYDGLIANTGKAGHYALEYAVVDSSQATIRKGILMKAMTFDEILKFNPYHDAIGRFSTADAADQFTIRTRDPGKQYMADAAIRLEKERTAAAAAAAGSDETPQMKAIHDIEDRIRNQDFESAACVDKDGNVLFFKDGEQSQVAFTQEECRMMAGTALTHNHPSSTSFSVEDVDCWLGNDIQEIRATNRLGITYSLSRGENFDKAIGENFSVAFHINRNKALRQAQQTLDDKGYPAKIARGEISIDQANAEFRDIFNTVMVDFCTKKAPDYGINFTVEKRDINKSSGTTAFTAKAADDSKPVWILDKDTEDKIAAAFNKWLDRAKKNPTGKSDTIKSPDVTAKSMEDSRAVLFIGLQISGADKLAIDGGEKPEDFHVTLAYGHFDTNGHDEDDTSVRVQHAIDDIRDLIPDSIHFDAMGRFEASKSSDGKDVIYAQVAAGQLEKAHDGLLEALKKHGIKLEGTFPTYKPHMTLAYIEAGSEYELKQIDASGTATKVMIGHGWESTKENNYTITKMDDDKRLVFGWASISFTAAGEQLEDLQHDIIDPADLEEAVYEYVLNFRDTGEEHRPHLRKKGKLVESCVFTAEKQKAMGLPDGILPVGWWIGFKIEDDEAWEKVKNGTYKMFSIEGKAQRVPVEKAAPVEPEPVIRKHDPDRYDKIVEVEKFNPYHDAKGRFATANGYASFTIRTKDPSKQHMANAAIAREKERAAADATAAASNDAGKKKIAEAEEQIKAMLKDGAVVKLEGIDPENAEPIRKSIEQVLQRYPSTKDAYAGFTTDDPDGGSYFADHEGTIACYNPNTQMIHLNKAKYADRAEQERRYQEAVDRKHFPQGTTCDSSIVHEMGHAIDWYVSKKIIPEREFYWSGERVSRRMWNNDIKNAKKKGDPLTGKSITDGLSRYAGSKPAEYLAEGFSEWITSPNPRPMATSIGKRLETYIKKAAKAGG